MQIESGFWFGLVWSFFKHPYQLIGECLFGSQNLWVFLKKYYDLMTFLLPETWNGVSDA